MLTRYARKDQEPATDPRLASVLDAAAAPAEPGPAPGEAAALATFRSSVVRADSWRSRMPTPATPLKSLCVAAASASLLLTGGIAAANAGVLPGAAQDSAQEILGNLGVDVPGGNEHSAGHADTRGHSDEAPPTDAETATSGTLPDAAAFGQMISELAKSTESGPGKGQTISEAAKTNGQVGEHGQAGEHGSAPERTSTAGEEAAASAPAPAAEGEGGQSGDHARVVTPNDGGTSTADDASADNGGAASTSGTEKAGTASDGHSTAGSDNRP
jgi:hypothetical protein